MKKSLLAIFIVTVTISFNASAISERFRQQLDSSGCTQVTEANGSCDISKTKAHKNQHNEKVFIGYDVEVVFVNDASVTVNGKAATMDENNADATVFKQGIYTIIHYHNGNVSLLKNNVYVGKLKKAK